MNFTLTEFRAITFAIFFIYVFIDSKIYLALWAALYHLVGLATKAICVNDALIYKTVIATYVIMVLAGYLYKFKGILLSNEEMFNNGKWRELSSDKNRQLRIGSAILLLIIVNVTAMFFWRT